MNALELAVTREQIDAVLAKSPGPQLTQLLEEAIPQDSTRLKTGNRQLLACRLIATHLSRGRSLNEAIETVGASLSFSPRSLQRLWYRYLSLNSPQD